MRKVRELGVRLARVTSELPLSGCAISILCYFSVLLYLFLRLSLLKWERGW